MSKVANLLENIARNNFQPVEKYIRDNIPQSKKHRDDMFNISRLLMEKRHFGLACDGYKKIIAWDGDDLAAISNLSAALISCGRYTDVVDLLAPLLELHPNFHALHANFGGALVHLGRFEPAIASILRAIEIHSENASYFELLGSAYLHADQPDNALAAYRKALSIDQYCVPAYVSIATLLYKKNLRDQSKPFASMALKIAPNNLGAIKINVELFIVLGRDSEARTLLMRGRKLYPEDASLKRILSAILINEGDIDESNRLLASISSDMLDPMVLLSKTLTKTGASEGQLTKAEVVQLEEMVAKEGNAPLKLSAACAALSNYYSKTDDVEKDFDFMCKANEFAKVGKKYNFSAANYHERTNAKIQAYSKAWIDAELSNNGEKGSPIFIIGMPRSGSTLVEQVLASHPELMGLGEIDDMTLAIKEAQAQYKLQNEGRLNGLTSLSDVYPLVADNYLSKVSVRLEGKKRRVVDKMLFNHEAVNIIHKALPLAKFIHIKRHPVDNCLGMYRRLFQFDALNFTLDLDAIADVFIAYHRLMQHWHIAMPDVIMDVSYEQLVQSPEAITRSMLDYCDLAWDDNCLNFHQQKRKVTTASAAQVRQPVYTSAVGRWKRYESYIKPLLSKLEGAGISY